VKLNRSAKEWHKSMVRIHRGGGFGFPTIQDAYQDLSTLFAENARLREALKPFVAIIECGCSFTEDDADTDVWFVNDGCRLTVGHFRAARRALGGSNET